MPGSLPTLTGSGGISLTLAGGTGGNGGASILSGPGGRAGGGAGGGFGGGVAGVDGAPGGLAVSGGTNGGPAGSQILLLALSGSSEVPTGSAAVGTFDPSFLSSSAGAGGGTLTAGQNGRIVLEYAAIPEARAWLMLGTVMAGYLVARAARWRWQASGIGRRHSGLELRPILPI